jgi:DNA (cytosine-5)-methyltransferase 1
MIGIEIFSGAGGMSVGAEMAGIKVKMAVEIDQYAAETFAVNHPKAFVINKDIRRVKSIDIKSGKERKILFGGPPCQGFSRSNHRTRNLDNPNNWLFTEFIRIAKLWKPDWLVLENVEGLINTESGLFIESILEKFEAAGYTASPCVLNAMDFGVPQNRTRLFVVGSLHGIEFEFPDPWCEKYITVKDAIDDLPVLDNGNSVCEMSYSKTAVSEYAKALRADLAKCNNHKVSRNLDYVLKRYPYIPQGGNWQNIPKRLMSTYSDSSRCHTGIYHRLDESKVSVMIGNYRKTMLVHPVQHRGLSVREAARLQSFPDSFLFKGYLGNQQQQVGNAVPPLLAKAVFEKIINYK